MCATGRFQYDTTTPAVFSMARELVQHDVPVSRLSRTLFEEHRFAYLQLLGDALGRAHLVPERRFVWTAVTQGDLAKYQVTIEEVEGLRPGSAYDVRLVVRKHGGGGGFFRKVFGGGGAALSLKFDAQATAAVESAHRGLQLDLLKPGNYVLELTVSDKEGRRDQRVQPFQVIPE